MIFDGDRAELGRYIRDIADRVGLRDWTINLFLNPIDASECVIRVSGGITDVLEATA